MLVPPPKLSKLSGKSFLDWFKKQPQPLGQTNI
jgi:hypothetical protein